MASGAGCLAIRACHTRTVPRSSSRTRYVPCMWVFMTLRDAWAMLKATASDWDDDAAPRLAAALAYYTLLSIAPLLVIAMSAAGLLFGEDAARGRLATDLGSVVGPDAARG